VIGDAKAAAPSRMCGSEDANAPSATGRIHRGEQGRGYNICEMASRTNALERLQIF